MIRRRFIGSAKSVNVMTLLDKWSGGRSDVGVELIGDTTEIRFEGILKAAREESSIIAMEIKTTDGSWCTIALDKTSISTTRDTIKGETLEGMAFTLERF
ncbi:MAG: hypothetical protein J6Y78_09335 [Paludibacteraceae bacterium]|nr:hypothetical protein [Paludibacteraceae bacterium]